MEMFGDVGVNYFGVGSPIGEMGALGVTVKSIDMGDIPVTTRSRHGWCWRWYF